MVSATAQFGTKEYEPTTNWPYLLNDFYNGTIVMGTDSVSRSRLNFHLRSLALYCIDDEDKVARVIFPNISCVIINNNIYRLVDGKPMQQLYAEQGALLMEYTYIDFDLMNVGYNQGMALYARASSETAMLANRNNYLDLETIHMRGEFNENYHEMRTNWYDGQKLPLHISYYFVIDGRHFRAVNSECNGHLDAAGQKALKRFIKEKKLKWKKKEDLVLILQFMKKNIKP